MHSEFRGECNYQAESNVHFPHLTVAETLDIAAEARTPPNSASSRSDRKAYARSIRDETALALGLSHTLGTKIGNDFIRGISGGERQRTSLAEVMVCDTSFQCWDNSVRGLDSGNALKFAQVLRSSANITGSTHIFTIYQASQSIYDLFDKVVLLYEGRQIFFGDRDAAIRYFF